MKTAQNIEKRDFEVMVKIVRKMAKRLSSIHSKKRKRQDRGHLDFRKTLRQNMAYDGAMFKIYWKSKKWNTSKTYESEYEYVRNTSFDYIKYAEL